MSLNIVQYCRKTGPFSCSIAALLAGTLFPLQTGLASGIARISNLSTRVNSGSGTGNLIVGFVIGGADDAGTIPVLVRAVGPSLAPFGVTGFIADPQFALLANGSTIATNDDWLGNADVSRLSAQVGAFSFVAPSSKDAALVLPALGRADYSVQATGVGGSTGIVLVELYHGTPDSGFLPTTARLINIAVRAQVGVGNDVLIAGFAITGTNSKPVLIRGIGPGLATFNVPGALANPKLDVFASGASAPILSNDDWQGASVLSDAFTAVGAFTLLPSSQDSALIAVLNPGVYSVVVSGVGNTTGIGLVEVYELPSVKPVLASTLSSSTNFHAYPLVELTTSTLAPAWGGLSFQLTVNGSIAVPWQSPSTLPWRPEKETRGTMTFIIEARDWLGASTTQTFSRYVYRAPPRPD